MTDKEFAKIEKEFLERRKEINRINSLPENTRKTFYVNGMKYEYSIQASTRKPLIASYAKIYDRYVHAGTYPTVPIKTQKEFEEKCLEIESMFD